MNSEPTSSQIGCSASFLCDGPTPKNADHVCNFPKPIRYANPSKVSAETVPSSHGVGGNEAEPQGDSGFIADKANEPHGRAHSGRASAKFEPDDLDDRQAAQEAPKAFRDLAAGCLFFRTKAWLISNIRIKFMSPEMRHKRNYFSMLIHDGRLRHYDCIRYRCDRPCSPPNARLAMVAQSASWSEFLQPQPPPHLGIRSWPRARPLGHAPLRKTPRIETDLMRLVRAADGVDAESCTS